MSHRIAMAALVFASVASSHAHAQVVDCPPGEPICAQFWTDVSATTPGTPFTTFVQPIVRPGVPVDDLELEFTVTTPTYFAGVTADSVSTPWTRHCELVVPAPVSPFTPPYAYGFRCTYTNLDPVADVNGIVSNPLFELVVRPQRYSEMPDGYVGEITLSYTARSASIPGGEFTVDKSASVTVDGTAGVVLTRTNAPTHGYADFPVVTIDFGDGPVTGRRVRVTRRLYNALGVITVPGTNQLANAAITVPIPPEGYYVGHGIISSAQLNESPLVVSEDIPTDGLGNQLKGGEITAALVSAIGRAERPTGWNLLAGNTELDPLSDAIWIDILIPCEDLEDVIQNRVPVYATGDGDELLFGGAPIPRTWTDPVDVLDVLGSTTGPFPVDMCEPSAGLLAKSDSISDNVVVARNANTWYIRYNAPFGTGPMSDVRIIDAVPPLNVLTGKARYYDAAETAIVDSHPNFHAVYCRYPDRKTLSVPTGTGAAPSSYRWVFGDFDPAVLYDGPTPVLDVNGEGCLPDTSIQFPTWNAITEVFDWPAPAPNTLRSDAVDFIVWVADDWVALDANGDPDPSVPPQNLWSPYATRTTSPSELAQPIAGSDQTRASVRNTATLTQGTYVYGGQTRQLRDVLPEHATGNEPRPPRASVTHEVTIVDTVDLSTNIYGDGDPGTTGNNTTFAFGQPGHIATRWITTARLQEPRVEIDLPRGFDLAPTFLSSSSRWRWLKDGTSGVYTTSTSVPTETQLIHAQCVPQLSLLGVPPGDIQVSFELQGALTDPERYWRVTWQFPPGFNYGTCGGSSVVPFYVSIVPRPDYTFTSNGVPTTSRIYADNYVGPTGLNYVTATTNVYVPVAEEVSAGVVPTCEPGDGRPVVEITVANSGGQVVEGLKGILTLPTAAGGIPITLRGASIVQDSWLPNVPPLPLEATTFDPPQLAGPGDWQALSSFSDLGAVTGLRVRWGDDTEVEPFSSVRVRALLDHPSATLDDIGATFTAVAWVGTDVITLAPSQDSPPYTIGECPVAVPVIKFFDAAPANGVRDPGEPGLPGWTFSATGGSLVDDEDSNATGGLVFDLLPGDWTLSETIEAGTNPTWTATTGLTRGITVGFVSPPVTYFGNTCSCNDSNACTTDTCDAGTCVYTPRVLECEQDDDVCVETSGSCDPATGECRYDQTECLPGEPTRVYLMVEDASLPGRPVVGALLCLHDGEANPTTLTCVTDTNTGELVVDPTLTCGE